MIIKYLKNFFNRVSSKSTETKENDIFSSSDENAFGLSLDDTGSRLIRFNLQKLSDKDAVWFAEALFGAHNGVYEQQSLEMLEDISKMDDKEAADFALKVLAYYDKYRQFLNNPAYDDGPIVRPSEYLKIAREKHE